MARSYAVVVNECTAVVHSNVRAINTRRTANADPNFRIAAESLVKGLPRELTTYEMDWLELVSHLYATDLACERGAGDTDWGRDIELHVPLRHPATFQAHVVAMQEIFAELTGDRLRLTLHGETEPSEIPRYGTPWPRFDCVALQSGGVDSHVGALELIAAGRTPLLLSHGSGANTTPQKASRRALERHRSGLPNAHLTTDTITRLFPAVEASQRARSILFMGAAALVAAVAEVDDVFLNENGVMAVHVPLTPARFGSLSTKTAYPPIVDRMEAVAASALGRPIRMRNLLVARTKPEVVERAVALGAGPELHETASCWTWWRKRKHCGVCIPCLQRRISFEIAGVSEPPHADDPLADSAALKGQFAHDNLVHLCASVQHLAECDDATFELDHTEILDGGSHLSPVEARDLYRRWAAQALDVLSRHPNSTSILR